MGEKVQEFLRNAEEEKKRMLDLQKKEILDKLGLYTKEYCPMLAKCMCVVKNDPQRHISATFENLNIKKGDIKTIKLNEEKVEVIVESIQYVEKESEIYKYKEQGYSNVYNTTVHFRKIYEDVSDEEFLEIKKHIPQYKSANVDTYSKNATSSALVWIAVLIYIGGFFAGIGVSDEMDSFVGFLVCGISAFVSGTTFLGFAEIIKLLQEIKDK